MATKRRGFFSDSNQKEATKIEQLLDQLSTIVSFKEAYEKISKTYAEMNKTYGGIVSFSNTTTGKLIKQLLRNLDKPELRELRSYADELEGFVGDEIALKKGKALHSLLNDLLDENSPKQIKLSLKEAATSKLFQESRHIIHFGQTTTVKLLNQAIKNIKHSVEMGLYHEPIRNWIWGKIASP